MASSSKVRLQEILKPIANELIELEDRLINQVSADSRILKSIMQDIFKAGGKRMRPAISFLVYKTLLEDARIKEKANTVIDKKVMLAAELAELIHTASLVHDDIIDNSFVRRGKETANSKWDNAVTVICGDFMFARAAVNLGKLDCNEVVCLYAAVLENLCDGEIEQVEKKYSTDLDWDYYYSKTYKKTASLFEASAKAPAALLELEPAHKDALAQYGRALGMAFQVVDDILDYSSNEATLGKPAGSDLREGQVTLPALYTLEELDSSNPEQAQELREIIQMLNINNPKPEALERALKLIKSSSAIKRSQELAQSFIDEAIKAIEFIPDSAAKQSLTEIARLVIERES